MPLIPGLMSYSYHLSFSKGKITPQVFMDRVEELNLKSTEWCHFPCHEPGMVDWNQVKLLDRIGREKGIMNSISGFAPLLAQGAKRDDMLDQINIQLEVSKFIGANRMRFHGMTEMELGIGEQAPLDICLDNLKRVVELGEKNNIVIALENHMDFRIADFRYFFSKIDSPFFAINLDTGNFLPLFEDVITFVEEFSDKIISCHFKGSRFIWQDYGAVLTSCRSEKSLINLKKLLILLASCTQEIATHIEVVAMNSDDEDLLVADYARFLHDFLKEYNKGVV